MFVYRASGSDQFSFGLCSIALLSLSAQRCLSFHPSLALFVSFQDLLLSVVFWNSRRVNLGGILFIHCVESLV